MLRLSPYGQPTPKRPCLVVVAGPRLGEVIPIVGEVIIGRDADATLALPEDQGVSRRHVRVTPVADGALVSDLGSANGTYVDGERVSERVLKEGDKLRVGQTTILRFVRFDELEELAQRQLLDAALRDPLTRVFNRRYFMQRLEAELRFADRHMTTVSLLLIDIDHFKAVNDEHGHPAGDHVLCRLALALGETLRAEDVLSRYGGEEFCVVARSLAPSNTRQLAERLRLLVENTRFEPPGKQLRVTISVGIALYPFEGATPDRASDLLIERADAALYRAKRAGRNRIST